ncbi:alkylglycerol monooxygenase-like [Odontomachus brunneus]|uniref:alkylglycerol monooxygenase-like n=1 Tax=Odontomachus brunneus TaxID=486640 RepID=UPI0013F207E5|nr:alkylglycerol monooxygenase-like [Odontomachus brunneus]XP_032690637.1 alkylglycerol monooxygenase-like [Odontomachus brunneus]XP_032690703.1 alkylglycerol monooxygenase-like [Odontomachus brunneus]XP_032690759.1 alkylglycerol monooxygenase-like [Odontomachus brunneus]XP_032690813.1 alkylglycerol monooxygenase-like [Odontomachus brunneus]
MNVTGADTFWKGARKLFYLVNFNETTYEHPEQVPDHWQEIWLPFFLLLIVEQIILCAKHEKKVRWNEQITSLSHWLFDETARFFSRGAEYYIYIQLYNKYHLLDLVWNAPSTWIIAALSVEFCYYWAHRLNHEVTFLWIFHQVHHSSEEFSLAVGLRQSILQSWCNFIFYLPLTLFIPPSHFISHKQFNMIYQLCLHTTLIGDCKPLDWAFNTAKHHRVHHGCNLYCLDKNYGGVLIIWDRLFGTFQEEKEEIVYGLVINSESFNPLYLQLHYLRAIYKKSATMYTWCNKIGTFWKGPSWFPGAPRLGLDHYKIYVTKRHAYNPYVPGWQLLYIFLHFATVIISYCQLKLMDFNSVSFLQICMVLNNVLALTSIGLLFDRDNRIALLEFSRCIFYLYIMPYNQFAMDRCVYILYFFSLYCIWIPRLIKLTRDYACEYSQIVYSASTEMPKLQPSLKNKILYIMKSFLRSNHVDFNVNIKGVPNSKKGFNNNNSDKYPNRESEATSRIRRYFLSH